MRDPNDAGTLDLVRFCRIVERETDFFRLCHR
jgi:hypothetical protein